MFYWWQGLVAGLVATAAMTPLLRLGAAMGMTRMNMSLMLGSMFRRDPDAARALGTAIHFMNGSLFGLAYALIWRALDPAIANAWWIGLILGAAQSFAVMAMMPVMSAIHPRVRATADEAPAADEVALPPFGFGGTGFGPMTPAGILLGHLVFGLVWGLVFWWLV